MSGPLVVRDTFDIPLREVSGICTSRRPDGIAALAAISDRSALLATAPLGDGEIGSWEQLDLAELDGSSLPARDTQAEGLALDGNGLVVVLLEEPGRAHVFDLATGQQRNQIDLVVPPGEPIAQAWGALVNSRGEGVVLLGGGHLLIVKEKDPPALLEFGPPGARPHGLGAEHVLDPGATWTLPPVPSSTYEALATWLLDEDLAEQLGDVSDVAVGFDHRLYLLSDQGSCIARLAPTAPTDGGSVGADRVRTIKGKPDKAEGLALLPDGRLFVALDTKKAKDNLLLLQ